MVKGNSDEAGNHGCIIKLLATRTHSLGEPCEDSGRIFTLAAHSRGGEVAPRDHL